MFGSSEGVLLNINEKPKPFDLKAESLREDNWMPVLVWRNA
jgi:hypothetical protein